LLPFEPNDNGVRKNIAKAQIQRQNEKCAALVKSTEAHIKSKEYYTAITDYLDPDNAEKYCVCGCIYHDNLHDYDKALADLSMVLSLESKIAKYHAFCSLAYSNKNDYDKAIDNLTQALLLFSKYIWAYTNHGKAYENKGDFDAAIEDYSAVIWIAPG